MAYICDLNLPPISAFPNFTLDALSSVIYNLYGIAIINDDIAGNLGTIACNKEQNKTKFMKSTSLRIFKVKFLTCNVFVFCKNVHCRLRSSCSRHDVNNGVKRK